MVKPSAVNTRLSLRTVYFWGLIPALILVPAWVGIGRFLFDIAGWMTVFAVILFVPVLFIGQSILLILNLIAERLQQTKMVSKASFIALSCYYVAVLVWGAAIPDTADVPTGAASILTKLFGGSTGSSEQLAAFSGFLAIVFLAWAIVTSVIHIALSKRQPK